LLPAALHAPQPRPGPGQGGPLTGAAAADLVGGELFERIRDVTLQVYDFGAALAESRGLILADTKLEFGIVDRQLLVIDEMLTPDSSRYWPADEYHVGTSPPSFDKQS